MKTREEKLELFKEFLVKTFGRIPVQGDSIHTVFWRNQVYYVHGIVYAYNHWALEVLDVENEWNRSNMYDFGKGFLKGSTFSNKQFDPVKVQKCKEDMNPHMRWEIVK